MSAAEQAKQNGREKTARERHDKIKPRVPLLTVRLEEGAPAGTAVSRDGIPLGNAAFGIALPVDPGAHTFVTQAPGGAPITETLTLADGDKRELVLSLKGGAPPPVAGGAPDAEKPALVPVAATPPADEPAPGRGRRTAGIALAAVGGVGLVVGAITGGLTLAKKSTINADCSRATLTCANGAGESAVSSAQTTGLVSTLGFVVGGVALAGGVVLIATAPASRPPAKLALAWSAAPTGGRLGLMGQF